MKRMIAVAVLSLSMAAMAADTVTKEASGEGAIVKGDTQKAFEEAVKQALRSAVEQAAGVYVQADTLVKNSQLIEDRVYAKAAGYVKKYDVVNKSADAKVVKVTIKAEVGTAELDKDVEAVKGMIARVSRKKVIVVTQEQAIDANGTTLKSEVLSTYISDTLKRDGWILLDEKGGGDKMVLGSGVGMKSPDIKEVMKVTDADYVVYGTVNIRYQPVESWGKNQQTGDQIFFPVTAEWDLAMYEVQSREQLAKVAGKFNSGDNTKISPTVGYGRTAHDICRSEGPKIFAQLRNPVLEVLRDREVNGNRITLKVGGLPDFDSVEQFQKSIQTVAKVTQVKPDGDFENGTQTFTVSTLGSAAELGSALGKSKFGKKPVKVSSVKNNWVEVAIGK